MLRNAGADEFAAVPRHAGHAALRAAAPADRRHPLRQSSLAVAAITTTALSLFHDLDATVMILIWNPATAAVFVGLDRGVCSEDVLLGRATSTPLGD